MSALASIGQGDFAVGVLRGVARDVQPGVGMHTIRNGLLDDDGDIYLRGGTVHVSADAVTDPPLMWMWSGVLEGVQVELAASAASFYVLLGTTMSEIGAIGGLDHPTRGAVLGRLYLPNGKVIFTAGATGVADVANWVRPSTINVGGPVVVEAIAGRLVVAGGDVVAFSEPMDPSDSSLPPVFSDTNFHRLPGGVTITGLFAIQDTLLVFTNYGLWAISNMAYDLTDAAGNVQQSLALLDPDLSLVNDAGLCGYTGRVLAACHDGAYLVDLSGPPRSVSESIAPLWRQLIEDGVRFGGAKVFRDTLMLPVLEPTGAVRTLLTCRLNRPVRGRLLYYPWSEIAGYGARYRFFDFRPPLLWAAHETGWIDDVTGFFDSGGADADGTVPALELETRDFPTGSGQPNHLKRVRVRYSSAGAGEIAVAYSSDPDHLVWTALDPAAVVDGTDPLAWWLPTVARVRYARLRLSTTDPFARLVIHQLELQVRQATHGR